MQPIEIKWDHDLTAVLSGHINPGIVYRTHVRWCNCMQRDYSYATMAITILCIQPQYGDCMHKWQAPEFRQYISSYSHAHDYYMLRHQRRIFSATNVISELFIPGLYYTNQYWIIIYDIEYYTLGSCFSAINNNTIWYYIQRGNWKLVIYSYVMFSLYSLPLYDMAIVLQWLLLLTWVTVKSLI